MLTKCSFGYSAPPVCQCMHFNKLLFLLPTAIEKSVWNGVVVFPHQKVYTKPEKKVEEKVEKNEKKDEDTEMTVVKSET